MSALLPIFVDVAGVAITVTGDGPAARDATALLERLGALVTRTGAVPPSPEHLEGALLLVSASDDPAADAAILEAAATRRLLTVSAHGPKGRAFLGACVQRGDLAVAATTSGQSPALERRMAESAAGAIGAQHERFAQILAGIRAKLEDRIPDDAVRTAIWEQILDSPVSLLLESGSEDDAIEMAERMAWGTG